MESAPQNDHIRKHHVPMTKEKGYQSNKVQFQNLFFSTFVHKNISLLSGTGILYRSSMA